MDAPTLLDGCIDILRRGTVLEKETVAEFLGQFGDSKAIVPLVAELDHPEAKVRRSVCYALSWLHAKGDLVGAKLVELCRNDPSPGVRVWAALALQGSHEKDALDAYQAGLESPDRSLWQLCEEELERMGKLKLPLPEHIYAEIRLGEYKSMKAGYGPRIWRETERNGTVYFECHEGGNDGIPIRYEWYQARLSNRK
jgi:hypothetical protein